MIAHDSDLYDGAATASLTIDQTCQFTGELLGHVDGAMVEVAQAPHTLQEHGQGFVSSLKMERKILRRFRFFIYV